MSPLGSVDPLAAQLQYVGHNVPYFRALGCDDGRPIEQFPFTCKLQIRNNYESFISDQFLNVRRPLVDFLTSKYISPELNQGEYPDECYFSDNISVWETTGTSGTVLRCPKSMDDRVRVGVGIWRQRRLIDSFVRPRNLLPFGIHYGLSPPFDSDPWNCDLSNLKSIYEKIRDSGYRWIHSRADLLHRQISVFQREGWSPTLPNLKFVELMGHFLHQEVAADLRKFFNVRVVDHYGMLETWTIAMSCKHGVLHINEHNVHVEIIDESDRPVRLGEVGQIVVTSLQQRLLPFIRYVTDDFGMFIEKLCDCKLGTKVLALIEGRSGNLIKGTPKRLFGHVFFRYALGRINCFDLVCIRIRQVTMDEFIVQTNAIKKPSEFMTALKKETQESLGEHIRFRHIIFDEAEISIQERRKPWLFRCEC